MSIATFEVITKGEPLPEVEMLITMGTMDARPSTIMLSMFAHSDDNRVLVKVQYQQFLQCALYFYLCM